jgi:AAHS family benzoate transporter-like MFS transporter
VPPGRVADRVTVVLFLTALVAGFAQFGAIDSLNDVAKHFGHLSSTGSLQSVVGLSGSMLGLGLAALRLASLLALPLASLADRWGRTKVLQRTIVLGLLATAAAALSPSYWFFVLCFAFARPLLSAASTVVQVITVELSSTARRITRLVIMAAGAGLGAGISAVLHGLIRGPDSFRWLFSLALLPVLVIVPLLRIIPEPLQRSSDAPLARLGSVPRSLRARLAIVATVVFAVGMITGPANGFTFVYGEGILKMSPREVATIVTLSAFTGFAGLVLSHRLAKSVGRRWTVALGVLATAVTASFAYSGGRTDFIIGYMVGIGAGGLLSPALTAISTEIFTHDVRATAAGWIVVFGVLGAVSGLVLFGWVGDMVHTSSVTALRVPALVTFLPFLPTLLLLRRLPESSRMALT